MRPTKFNLTADRLRELLDYDPTTGIFTWRVNHSMRARKGSVAGTIHPRGYRLIGIDHVQYLAHRLSWLYVHGSWPKDQVDHRHGSRDDNRLTELREATNSQNCKNRGKNRNNSSGYRGVSWNKARKKWLATICRDYKPINLGFFDSPEAASEAYEKMATQLYGEFKRKDMA